MHGGVERDGGEGRGEIAGAHARGPLMIDGYGIADQTSRHTDHERTNKERSGVVNSISGEKNSAGI
ncbi:hypothetical protein GCM10020001_000540 [Nonomuraea salmonea]